jgi:hypothetical protein
MARPLKSKQPALLTKIQFAPHKEHRVAICKAVGLMIYRDIKSYRFSKMRWFLIVHAAVLIDNTGRLKVNNQYAI